MEFTESTEVDERESSTDLDFRLRREFFGEPPGKARDDLLAVDKLSADVEERMGTMEGLERDKIFGAGGIISIESDLD